MTELDRTDAIIEDHARSSRKALRTIACFEAIKGLAALAAVLGVLDLAHRDVRHLAVELIGRFGWNPDARYASVVLHYADLLPGVDLRVVVVLGVGYALLRLLEACGLWNDRAWGEWLGALSGALYIPFEIRHLLHRPSVIGATVLAANIFLVSYLAYRLRSRHRAEPGQQPLLPSKGR